MTTAELLTHLRKLNVTLSGDNGQLVFRGPKGALTAELRTELKERKAEILDFLKTTAHGTPSDLSLRCVSRERIFLFRSRSSGCGSWTSWNQAARSITFQGRFESKVHSMRKSWSAASMRSFDAMKLCAQRSQPSKKSRFRLLRHQQMFPCR